MFCTKHIPLEAVTFELLDRDTMPTFTDNRDTKLKFHHMNFLNYPTEDKMYR